MGGDDAVVDRVPLVDVESSALGDGAEPPVVESRVSIEISILRAIPEVVEVATEGEFGGHREVGNRLHHVPREVPPSESGKEKPLEKQSTEDRVCDDVGAAVSFGIDDVKHRVHLR